MEDNELLAKIIKKTISKGADYADIFIEHKSSSELQLEDNKIEKVVSGHYSGIGLRLIYKGKTFYAYSNDFSQDSLFDMASSVIKAAEGASEDVVINLKKKIPHITFPIKKFPNEIAFSTKVELVMLGNKIARDFHQNIKQVSIFYRDTSQKIKILNSEGFLAEDHRVYTTAFVRVIASDNDIIQTGYESVGGHIGFELFDNNLIEEIALKSAKRAVMMLKARRAPGGRMPVVISSEAGGTMIHEAIGHGLEADLVQQKVSVYSDMRGQKVASSAITVIDDATLPFKRGSFAFDDEGTPSKSNILVDKGILVNYMYDKYTALIDGVSSTGNGRRESYEHKPLPRMTNTFIAPGNIAPEDVIRSVTKGLLVKKMGGGQVNTVTGDFVFEVQEGYLIENGNITEPVRGATLIGNGPDVLKSIDMVASDLGFSIGTCGKDAQGVPVSDAMPTLRIPEIVVGGEVGQP